MNIFLRKKGFTMVEMIVALGVFAVAATLATSSYLTLTGAQRKAATLQTVQDNLRFGLEAMARDLRLGASSRSGIYFGYYCGNDFPITGESGNALTNPSGIPAWSPTDCPISGNGGSLIIFYGPEGKVVAYRHGNCGNSQATCIEKAVGEGPSLIFQPSDFSPVTSPDIAIDMFQFYVSGSARSDGLPTRISLVLNGTAQAGVQISSFHLNTTVTQREYRRAFQ